MKDERTLEGYWVHESWRPPHITVHRSSCGQCNDGRGKGRSRESGAWLWHGRFAYLGAAWWFAENRTVPHARAGTTRNCPDCLDGVAPPPEILRTPPETA